jgi:hypothetical protein
MDVKEAFYKDLADKIKPDAIFASNTSSLQITGMAKVSKRPSNFVGLHFFNPGVKTDLVCCEPLVTVRWHISHLVISTLIFIMNAPLAIRYMHCNCWQLLLQYVIWILLCSVQMMRLVEVIRHDTTSNEAFDLTKDFVKSIGKKHKPNHILYY